MTISSSLSASVAGLMANANRLATISDNIANSSTFGYRRATTEFNSLVLGGSGRSYTAGGVTTQNVRLVDQGGALLATNNATDLAVSGRGLLPVASVAQVNAEGQPDMLLATTGSFRQDADGFLVNESGYYLLGWPANADGSIPDFARGSEVGLEPIQVTNTLVSNPTTSVELSLNLAAEGATSGSTPGSYNLNIDYIDNLGVAQSLDAEFTPTGNPNEWTMIVTDSAQAGAVIGDYTITFDDTTANGGQIAGVVTNVGGAYDPISGVAVISVLGGPISFDIGAVNDSEGGLSQLGNNFAPISLVTDGSAPGNVVSVEVDANGFVAALYDNGETQVIYQVPLVDLPNPNGLVALDHQTYQPSPDSGDFFLWDAGDGPTGDIRSFTRQESATDVAQELTNMIQTQRAYSSNAKVVQTVDEMLQETTNIKR